MSFDALAEAIFNVNTIYICLAVYVVTYFFRRLAEGVWRILIERGVVVEKSLLGRIWAEVLLPVFPILVGGLMGFMTKTIIWPSITNGTKLGQILYGSVCGLFSAFVYNRIRGWIKSKPSIGSSSKEDDNFLPPLASEPPMLEGTTVEKDKGGTAP